MTYTSRYASPLGDIILACDEDALIGLWFNGQKYCGSTLPAGTQEQERPLLREAKEWLDIYFSGRQPDFLPPLRYDATPFRKAVCDIMSAQAVGGAVGRNPISLMIPCHRVVGTNGSLTGYAGGIRRKVKLLELEHADMTGLFVPKRGAAL